MIGRLGGNQKFTRKGRRKGYLRHVRRRSQERLGVKLNKNQYNQLVQKIKKGNGTFVKKKSANVSVWRLKVDKHEVRCVYDKRIQAIITIYR